MVSSPPPKRLFLAVVAGLLLLASGLRLETYDQRPLWFDERATYKLSLEIEASNLLELARGDSEHPTLHPLIISFLIHSIDPIAAIRLPSVVCGVLSVALLIWLGTLLFDRRVALVAGTLMTFSVYHINYSQDGRAYTLLLVLTLGQYLSLLSFWRSLRFTQLIPFPFLAICSVYAHHLGVLIQGSLVLTAITLAAVDVSRGNIEERPAVLRKMMMLAFAWIVVGIVYLPQLSNTASWVDDIQRKSQFTIRFSFRFFQDVLARWGSGAGWIATCYGLLFAIGAVAMWRRVKIGVILSIWLVVPFAAFALVPFRHFFDLRYVMMALPAFFLVLASGIVWFAGALATAVSGRGAPFSRESLATATLVALLAILIGFSTASYLQFRQTQSRCSEIFTRPQGLRIRNAYCSEYLLLNTMLGRDRYILETY